MKTLFRLRLFGAFLALTMILGCYGHDAQYRQLLMNQTAYQNQMKADMKEVVDVIRNQIKDHYAPYEWKAQEHGWSLDQEIQNLKDRIDWTYSITVDKQDSFIRRPVREALRIN